MRELWRASGGQILTASAALDFRLRGTCSPHGFSVRLTVGQEEAEEDFAVNLGNRRLKQVLDGLETGNCTLDDLRDLGATLWSGLMAGRVGELFEATRARAVPLSTAPPILFRLSLPAELEPLPWEALYSERDVGFIACHPQHAILRTPSEAVAAPAPPQALARVLKILAVIPAGSFLDVEREWHNLEVAVSRVRSSVQVERLAGRVSPDRLAEALQAEPWDVVHFIGHGEQSTSGRTLIRLNDESGGTESFWTDGEAFASLFVGTGVRLVVLNCCLGAKPAPRRSLSGVGPFLVRSGVPAIVAMRFEIPDRVAIKFSDKFYHELFHGRWPGRVDAAVERAREAIFRNQTEDSARAFITPVLFLVKGCEQLFHLRVAVQETRQERPSGLALEASLQLPAELVQSLRDDLCVPIVGPRVLTNTLRSVPSVAGPLQLARELATRASYPYERDFEISEAAGDWMDFSLLERVCQFHVANRHREVYKLAQAIQNAYRTSEPPAILARMAEWRVPGIFYLYFDGLLEGAFDALRKPVRVVNRVDEPVPPGDEPLLINVRGSHADAESLVLTEQDHDRLWDRIGRMTPGIAELVRGHLGRSLLFIGVSPRDPLVKRLASKLLEQASARTLGPIFFVCRRGEAADPYWDGFPVTWMEGDLEAVIQALTWAARTAG